MAAPTPIPSDEKNAFIALVRVAPYPGGETEALRLEQILINYSDIPTAIGRQLGLYGAANQYLSECMAVFNDNNLQAVGIYVNKTDSPAAGLTNPKMIINSTYTGTMTITADQPGLTFLGNTSVKRVEVQDGVNLANMYLGPGATVDMFDSSGEGYPGKLERLWLVFANNNPSRLNSVAYGSVIGSVYVDPGSYYGGMDTSNPQNTCAIPVTQLTTTAITSNSVELTWTPPGSGYLFIYVAYKKTSTAVWQQAQPSDGGFQNFSGEAVGFVFNSLESDTYYDFKVSVRCNNGGIADAEVSAKTVCCG